MRSARTKAMHEGLVAVHQAAPEALNTAEMPWHASC